MINIQKLSFINTLFHVPVVSPDRTAFLCRNISQKWGEKLLNT